MKYESLPDGSQIPVLGLGTWRMGGSTSPDTSQDDFWIEAIQTALELGYRHLDTAERYGDGHAEELIREAIRSYPREDLFLTTKVSAAHLRYEEVHDALAGSLQRLGTDFVDLYLIHWWNEDADLAETFRALNELVADGRVRRLGVSNFNVDQMKEAQSLSDTPIATNQVSYSVLNREPEENGVLAYCQANGIVLTAYSPLKDGVLDNATVRELAEKYDATPAQVGLKWLLDQPGVITIPKASSRQHLADNMAALDLTLSDADRDRLNTLSE